MEYTSGKVVELNNASTQGLKDVVMSASSKVFIVDVVDSLFCEKTKFLCATSFVKILDEGSFYHLSGRGSLVFAADELISLEEDEKIMINYDALVAYDEKVKKELVKSLDLLFWYVSGPGTCAVSWNKIEDQNQKTKTTDAKNAQEVKEDSEDNKNTTIHKKVFGSRYSNRTHQSFIRRKVFARFYKTNSTKVFIPIRFFANKLNSD